MKNINYIAGENLELGENVKIGKNVKMGKNVKIDDFSRILDNVEIGNDCYIGAYSTIGEEGVDYFNNNKTKGKTIIGNNALIRSHCIIYHSIEIGNNFQTGHRVTIREKSIIGNNVRIGTLSDVQGDCKIENYVNIHSNVHVGQKSKINDFVWIFPYCVLTNDPTPPSNKLYGVEIEKFAVIATGSIILPGIKIGEGVLVGAKTLVNRNVEKETVVIGNPMKNIGDVRKLKDKDTGESAYPWQYTFERGMPWENIGYLEWKKGGLE